MGKVRKKYSNESLDAALRALKSGQSSRSVSKSFNIPRSTLIAGKQGRPSIGKRTGPSNILSPEEENRLLQWMQHLNKRGFPVTKRLFLMSVANLVEILQKENPFKDGIPGRSWYSGFRSRHPEITSRIAQNLTTSRVSVTEESLRKWFAETKIHLDDRQLTNVDGSRVFNCDESAFHLVPKGERVLVPRGDKSVKNYVFNGEKEWLTVFFMTNAVGDLAPPMVIFPYERLPTSISETFPAEWAIGKTKNRWNTADSFFEYIANVFEPWLTQNKIQRPVVLYVDGHSSHVTLPIVDFCMEHEIELLALFPNSTHIIEPCDKALFAELKQEWKRCLMHWGMQNQRKLRCEEFGPLLKNVVDSIDLKSLMKNGFRSCGLHPFTPDALNYNEIFKIQRDTSQSAISEEQSTSSTSVNEIDNALRVFESKLDATLLQAFKKTEMEKGPWTGDVSNTGLFVMWQKLHENSMRGISEDANPNRCNTQSSQITSIVTMVPDGDGGDMDTDLDIINMDIEILGDNEMPEASEKIIVFSDAKLQADSSTTPNVNNNNVESKSKRILDTDTCDKPTLLDLDYSRLKTAEYEENGNSALTSEGVPIGILDAFKDALYWSMDRPSTSKPVRTKTPSAGTTLPWRSHIKAKEDAKLQKQLEAAEKARKQREAAEKKRQEQEDKKSQKEEQRAKKLAVKAEAAEEVRQRKVEKGRKKALAAGKTIKKEK